MAQVTWVESARGTAAGAPRAPLVLFGRLASKAIGELISNHSTLRCALVPELPLLEPLLTEHEVVGLAALSRAEQPGEAGLAIATVQRVRPAAATLYHAWDYDPTRAAQHALEYGADGLLMPAVEANDLLRLVFGALERKARGVAPPADAPAHVALLRQLAPTSPFWQMKDQVVSQHW